MQCTPTLPNLALITLSVPDKYMYRLPASVTPDDVKISCLSNPCTNFAISSLETCNKLQNLFKIAIYKY